MLGEENDVIFAQNLLENLIQIWNENIKNLREDFEAAMEGKVLQALDDFPRGEHDEEVSQQAINALKDSLAELKTVTILKTQSALKCFGCIFQILLHDLQPSTMYI